MPATSQRRLLRTPRHRAALGLSALATVAVFAALATRTPLLVALAGLLAAGSCWWAVRLLADDAVDARVRHAGDRAELARAYRALFAERSLESTAYVGAMTARLIEAREGRERAETALGLAQRRASRAELALGRAGHRIVVLETRVADLVGEVADLRERLEAPGPVTPEQRPPAPEVRRAPALPIEADEPPALPAPTHRAASAGVPEWDDPRWREQLDPDPAEALLAWEAYSRRLAAGRHADERRQA